jgi:hypothetical protein
LARFWLPQSDKAVQISFIRFNQKFNFSLKGVIRVMATVKRYNIFCPKCQHKFPVFASIHHTIDIDGWVKEKSDTHDCKAYADQLAKERAPRALNPIKASKKGK